MPSSHASAAPSGLQISPRSAERIAPQKPTLTICSVSRLVSGATRESVPSRSATIGVVNTIALSVVEQDAATKRQSAPPTRVAGCKSAPILRPSGRLKHEMPAMDKNESWK